MTDEALRCPHCGGPTKTAENVHVLNRNSSDGRQWTRGELDRETVLRCLDCGRQFSERHARWARTGEPPPS